MSGNTAIHLTGGVHDIRANAWNALAPDHAFTRHEFFAAMEQSGSVNSLQGWDSCHLLDDAVEPTGIIPLYLKHHSYGEFVFDWTWADASQKAGLAYYPKLLTASPYSPVTGARLLGKAAPLIDAGKKFAQEHRILSWHVLFPLQSEIESWTAENFLLRTDLQFQWFDRGYGDFAGFLAALSSKRRKEIRRERQLVKQQSLEFRTLHGNDIDAELWSRIHECYARTYHLRARQPYLDVDFFLQFARALPDRIVVFSAWRDEQLVAAAICLRDAKTLYGRYWGSLENIPYLHFELCYYQGLEYCLRHGLTRFEPGTQGEHKVSRGFEPVKVHSLHWFNHVGMHHAIHEFIERETMMINEYLSSVREHLPFRHADSA